MLKSICIDYQLHNKRKLSEVGFTGRVGMKVCILGKRCLGDGRFKKGKLVELRNLRLLDCLSEKNYPNPEDQERKFEAWRKLFSESFGEPEYEVSAIGRALWWETDDCLISVSTIDGGKSPFEGGLARIQFKEAK